MKKLSPGKKIKQLRLNAGMTQKQLAVLLDKSESAVRMWELDRNEPDISILLMLSKIFECSIDYILENEVSTGNGYMRSGIPYYTVLTSDFDKNKEDGVLFLSKDMVKNNTKYFGLLMADDSMMPFFEEKELVIARKQDTCFNGQHAILTVANENALVRRVRFQGDGILLQPENAKYSVVYYSALDIQQLPIKILGTAICSVKEIKY